MAAEVSSLARLAISAIVAPGSTPGDPTLLLNFGSWEKGIHEVIANGNMMRGELSQRINRVRTAQYRSTARLSLAPTAVEMARILDWSLGAAPSGTTYALGNGVREAQLMYDDNTTVWAMARAAVSTLTLRSSDSDPILHAEVGILAINNTSGATFPSGLSSAVVDGTTQPLIHQDTTLSGTSQVSVNSAATLVSSIEFELDNHLLSDRFFNSMTLTGFVKPDRTMSLKLTYPFGEFPSLYAAAAAENVGIPVTITYTCGNTSLVMTFPQVLFPREPVTIPVKNEVVHQITGIPFRTAGAEALVITLDSTP